MDLGIPDWAGLTRCLWCRFISRDWIMTNGGSYESRAWACDIRKALSWFYQRIWILELDIIGKVVPTFFVRFFPKMVNQHSKISELATVFSTQGWLIFAVHPPLYLTFSEGSRGSTRSTEPANETSNRSHDRPTFENIRCGGTTGLNLPLNRHTDIIVSISIYYLNCEFWETMWLSHDRNAASPRKGGLKSRSEKRKIWSKGDQSGSSGVRNVISIGGSDHWSQLT